MNELVPALVPYAATGYPADSFVVDVTRLRVNKRPSRPMQMSAPPYAAYTVDKTQVWPFTGSGGAVDLTVDGSSSAKVFTLVPPMTARITSIVILLITSMKPVFNGASFGGQYQTLLNLVVTTNTPGALANGLLLQVKSGGVTSTVANMTVNEDFFLGQPDINSGNLPGGSNFGLRVRWDLNQPLQAGTTDQMMVTVRDNLTNRGILEIRAMGFGAFI